MKRVVSVILAVMVMAVCSSFSAFAENEGVNDCIDSDSVNFSKAYKLLNGTTVSPEETFRFKIEKVGVSDSDVTKSEMPMFEDDTFLIKHVKGSADASEQGKEETASLRLPAFNSVGVYTYKITEERGNTAGVEYASKAVILKVYVTNCQRNKGELDRSYTMQLEDSETKVAGVMNTYSAGKLEISKTVTGLLGDTRKEFNVKVTFTKPADKAVKSDISYNDGEDRTVSAENLNDGSETVDISVKDGETVTFDNIPYGVTYSVQEDDYSSDGYTTTYSDGKQSGTIESASASVGITNSKGSGSDIRTGLIQDYLKYACALLAIAFLSSIFIIRRKKYNQ